MFSIYKTCTCLCLVLFCIFMFDTLLMSYMYTLPCFVCFCIVLCFCFISSYLTNIISVYVYVHVFLYDLYVSARKLVKLIISCCFTKICGNQNYPQILHHCTLLSGFSISVFLSVDIVFVFYCFFVFIIIFCF